MKSGQYQAIQDVIGQSYKLELLVNFLFYSLLRHVNLLKEFILDNRNFRLPVLAASLAGSYCLNPLAIDLF